MNQAVKVLETGHKDVLPSTSEAMALASNLTSHYGPAGVTKSAEIKSYPRAKTEQRPVGRPTKNPMSSHDYPTNTVVVLKTSGAGRSEFRVGWVGADDLKNLRPNGELNSEIAKRCFGSSPVFVDETLAESYGCDLFNARHKELHDDEFAARLPARIRGDSDAMVKHDAETHISKILSGGVKNIEVVGAWID